MAIDPENYILASNSRGPKMTIWDFSAQEFNHGLCKSPEAPSNLNKRFVLKIRETPNFSSNWTHYAGTKDVLKSIPHFKGKPLSHLVLQSLSATRRPFGDPNHLALHELGCNFFHDSFKENSKRLSRIKSVVRASSTSVFLGQLNLSILVVFQASCMALALLGHFTFHCENSITHSNSQDCQICIDPKQSMQPAINPP
ncbi:hypothetical protein O181_001725 [Austropuccinia psidii MF-1]|uniref:Uncharacterized protein n=1 Tax=Austropuccinia psidii MF-1 TaxID=1389203 RepID=A0A9Q3GC47_9BASI|nr:hypothetical protein [Austropuccinia psidii MF-1]